MDAFDRVRCFLPPGPQGYESDSDADSAGFSAMQSVAEGAEAGIADRAAAPSSLGLDPIPVEAAAPGLGDSLAFIKSIVDAPVENRAQQLQDPATCARFF